MPIKKTLEKSRKETTRSSNMREHSIASFGALTSSLSSMSLEERVTNAIQTRLTRSGKRFNPESDRDTPIGQFGDSLDLVELVMDLENEFNIGISESVVETLTTFNKIIQYIRFPLFTVTWEYAFDESNGVNILPLRTNIKRVNDSYNPNPFTIQFKVQPADATYIVTGTATTKNIGSVAQLTLTGTGNFTSTGSISSPSVSIIPLTPSRNEYF